MLGREAPDAGSLTVGDTVVPMYVEQDRDLGSDKCASPSCQTLLFISIAVSESISESTPKTARGHGAGPGLSSDRCISPPERSLK